MLSETVPRNTGRAARLGTVAGASAIRRQATAGTSDDLKGVITVDRAASDHACLRALIDGSGQA